MRGPKWCLALLATGIMVLPGLGQTTSSSNTQSSPSPAAVTSPAQPSAASSTESTTSSGSAAGSPTPAPADPQPLPMPSMSGPLQTAVPHEVQAGPFGKLAVTGILSGVGLVQGNRIPGDKATQWDLSNGQIFLQKTTGWWQFYLQGGALPTLIGAEYTFSFENINIERGLLWNQENAVNRGVQLNGTFKKLSASLSWNDGFYSKRYTWLWGSLTYAFNAANSLSFVAGGNAGQYAKNTLATPLFLNNSRIYNVIYTYSHESWMVQPYVQYTNVPTNAKIGIPQGAATRGGALLLTYNFKHGISMAARPEYISTTGSVSNGAINLLYGPGSGAFALTMTPTYRKDAFFLRGEFSIVHATSSTPGSVFGPAGLNVNQPRGLVEAGFMF